MMLVIKLVVRGDGNGIMMLVISIVIVIVSLIIMVLMKQEWEALTGQVVTDVRSDTAEMKGALPKWVDEERTSSVLLLKVS